MSAHAHDEILEEEEEEDDNIPHIRPEPEKILPPTFYEKVGDNLSLDLQKLIDIVISRYKLLKEVEYYSRRKDLFYKIINKKIPIDLTWDDEESINNDIASHFLLALICCQNQQELRWFIQQESLLYYARIKMPKYGSPKYDMYKILSSLGLQLKLFDPNQNHDIDINKIRFRKKDEINEKIYYINFIEAIHLIPQRAYYLHKGNLYILENDLGNLFFNIFQKKQYEIINKIKQNAEEIKKDKRIKEIIIAFGKEKIKYNFNQAAKITKEVTDYQKLKTIKDIEECYRQCFPLCMYMIEEHLNKFSHLMYLGRIQFTLFLKGAGLPVEEALRFFQRKYARKNNLEEFNKKYAYYIRYSYGLEGQKANFMPYNCERIIRFNPPIGDECHGCPFKNMNTENLRQKLSTCNLRDSDIEDILTKKKNQLYNACCVKYFQGKFIGSSGEGIGVHPNKYFSIAMKKFKGDDKNSKKKNTSKGSSDIKNNNENNIEDIKLNEIKINDGNNLNNNNFNDIDIEDITINDFDFDSDSNISIHKDKNDKDNNNSNMNIKEEKKEEEFDEDDDEENELDIDIDNMDFLGNI